MVTRSWLDILVCPYRKTKVELHEGVAAATEPRLPAQVPYHDDIPVIRRGRREWKDTEPAELPDPAMPQL